MTGTISPSARSNCKSRSFLVRKEPKEFSTKHAHRVENPVGMFFCAVLVLWRKVFHKGETGWGKSAGFSGERGCMGQKAGICPGKAAGRGKISAFPGKFSTNGEQVGENFAAIAGKLPRTEHCGGRPGRAEAFSTKNREAGENCRRRRGWCLCCPVNSVWSFFGSFFAKKE